MSAEEIEENDEKCVVTFKTRFLLSFFEMRELL
jgi:hypothetical protein